MIDCTNRYMIMNVVDCEINSLVIDMFRNFLRLFPSRYMIGPHKNHEKVILTFVVNALTQMGHNGTIWILWFPLQTVVHVQLWIPDHVIALSHVVTILKASLRNSESVNWMGKWLNWVPLRYLVCSQFGQDQIHFKWLNIKGFDAAFPTLILLFSTI